MCGSEREREREREREVLEFVKEIIEIIFGESRMFNFFLFKANLIF